MRDSTELLLKLGVVVLILLVAMLFGYTPQLLLVGLAMVLLNIIVRAYKRLHIPVEVEVATFGAIVITVAAGLKAGLLFALVAGYLGDRYHVGVSMYTVILIGESMLTAAIVAAAPQVDFVTMGIIAAVVVNIAVLLLYHVVLTSNPVKNVLYSLTNILATSYLLAKLGPFFVRMLA